MVVSAVTDASSQPTKAKVGVFIRLACTEDLPSLHKLIQDGAALSYSLHVVDAPMRGSM